jgi:hypothetical protein
LTFEAKTSVISFAVSLNDVITTGAAGSKQKLIEGEKRAMKYGSTSFAVAELSLFSMWCYLHSETIGKRPIRLPYLS